MRLSWLRKEDRVLCERPRRSGTWSRSRTLDLEECIANMEAAPTLADLATLPGTCVDTLGDRRRISLRSVAIVVRSGHLPDEGPVGPEGEVAWEQVRHVMIESVEHD